MASDRKLTFGIYSLLIIPLLYLFLHSQRLCLKCGQQPGGVQGAGGRPRSTPGSSLGLTQKLVPTPEGWPSPLQSSQHPFLPGG